MEKQIIKKVLAILMIITLMSADFFVLGSNLISYAAESNNLTNNKNIEFSTYFKDSKGEKVEKLETSIKTEDLKLYADITVKNEGYLSNATLELQNSNFNIKNTILSNSVASIDGNKVNLKQINAGSTETIELDIEPAIGDTLTPDTLLQASDLKFTGTYMETSYKGLKIDATREVNLDLQADQSASAELTTDIITNKIFSIDNENKRMVQVLVKSRLADNQYPIKQTLIDVDVTTLSEKEPEKVEVISLGTMATNGKTTLTEQEWKNENNKVEITLKNEDSTIKWNKNAYDELVVTYIYDANVDASKIEVNANSEITVHNSGTKYTAKYTKGIENQELNGIISSQSQISSDGIYKGQIASKITANYNTTTTIKITNTQTQDKLEIVEPSDVLVTDNSELPVNTKYIETKINKAKMLEILGQDGSITINDSNGTNSIINKDTQSDDNGDIVIQYQNATKGLQIETTKPQTTGVLEIRHSKAITENTYTLAQISNVKGLKTKNTVSGLTTTNSSESTVEVKDTISKAEFTVNKDTLSTMTENKDVALGVKLITDGIQYDLFKNPTIKIQLPSSVESVKINGATPLYADDFKVSSKYDNTNKTIEIKLNGEQNSHPETAATQLYLQLNLDITLSKLAPSKKDKITMTYTNENATQYDSGTAGYGIIEKDVTISAPSGLFTMYNSNTYNISGIKGISEEKQLIQISDADKAKDVKFDIALVNNTGANAKNVRILGKLPTNGNKVTGEEENTLQTALKGVTASNATIYYSENANATSDVKKSDNGWTTTASANAKVFLIVLDALNAESNYTASYTIQLPSPIQKDATAYTEYDVIYDTDSDKDVTTKSVAIGFATPTEIKIESNISAQVGNDNINSGDTVKAGEVIKYTMTAKNNGAQAISNVEVKSSIPDETIYVTPESGYQHSGLSYYQENESVKEIKETIQTLGAGETYTKTYEVRTKSDITSEKQISNKAVVTCNDTTVESSELTTKVQPSNIRVTIKEVSEDGVKLEQGGTAEYIVFIENNSNQDANNLQLKLINDNYKVVALTSDTEYLINDEIPDTISADKVPANGAIWYRFEGNIKDNVEQLDAVAIVKDANGNTYRSNKLGSSLPKADAKISLTSPQDKAYLKEGDIVEYNINVENTGESKSTISIADKVSDYFEIQAIYENGQVVMQTTETAKEDTYVSSIDNDVSYQVNLEAGGSTTLKIVAVVKNSSTNIDAVTITNKAEAKINQITKSTSEEVTHILKITADDIKNVINGKAWLDSNLNGAKDNDEPILSDIKVRLYNVATNDYQKDDGGNIIETTTNENGEYAFTKIPNGQYIVLFEYDTNKYEPTYYLKDGVDDSINSKVVFKNITINGEEKAYAVTDSINLEDNISNINIGLKEKKTFDLQLDKYISRISIQNSKGTKTYDYKDATFAKAEINRKRVSGTVVVLEYTIKVKNNGEVAGCANNIVDYLSNGLAFSSELNPDWYLSGNELYTKTFANDVINPGEEKEVKLVLTKTMTNENTGVVNNRAEIAEDYNEYGISDINSTPNNNMTGENDMGSADVIIGISTGGRIIAYIALLMINTVLIAIAIKLMVDNNIIKLKKERR